MKRLYVRLFIVLWLIFLIGCNATLPDKDQAENQNTELSYAKKVYYFQHKLIPQWVFESEGAFFFDLYNRQLEQFMLAAIDLLGEEYASQILVTSLYDNNSILIEFPKPNQFGNCFFALIVKEGDSYSYYTYEKTIKLGNDRIQGFVGGWGVEGGHRNYGPRSYKTSTDFVKDVLDMSVQSTN